MKKLIVFLIIIISVSCAADRKRKIDAEAAHITEKMAVSLNLSPEQKARVLSINKKRAEGHYAAYDAGRKKDIITAAVNTWETELKTVLTPEQADKLGIKAGENK
ncbi:MAG TPA: hypothetical protein PL048_11355 [Leptospiraceae bacterium]|nr:hypothetical protein [Leptospiraceae bacterium]HMY67848.1 hypothetical protein [Leptospiraceae bacterium]HMZ59365.1 hypothetical protein [Leptospiraceae bacterium]HNF15606.1 hypothetical protein [Leptospiraceae bacterium]HNF27777.1 hypothetical protein [Leptospiraceae bacterium]